MQVENGVIKMRKVFHGTAEHLTQNFRSSLSVSDTVPTTDGVQDAGDGPAADADRWPGQAAGTVGGPDR